jgi:hypothetical protein
MRWPRSFANPPDSPLERALARLGAALAARKGIEQGGGHPAEANDRGIDEATAQQINAQPGNR